MWVDRDASIDSVLYTSHGWKAFLISTRGKCFIVQHMPFLLGMTLLYWTRPIGTRGWPRIDRDRTLGQMMFAGIFVWVSICLTGLCFAASAGNPLYLHRIMSTLLPVAGSVTIAAIIAAAIQGDVLLTLVTMCMLLPPMSWFLFLREGLWLLYMVHIGVPLYTLTSLFCCIFGDYFYGVLFFVMEIQSCAMSCWLIWKRSLAMAAATALVRPDASCYAEVWERLRVEQADAISVLEREARELLLRSPAAHVGMIQQRDAFGDRVCDVDALLSQAQRLDGLLQERCSSWAAASGGELIAAPLKKSERAVQKAMRSYRGDPSRLCDLCRETVVFDEFQGLLAGLRTIAADDSVVFWKIKNRFDSLYDAASSAGYRDVCLVLQLRTPAARAEGLEFHLCEVQLNVRQLYQLKCEDGHRRYVQWRNIRCE